MTPPAEMTTPAKRWWGTPDTDAALQSRCEAVQQAHRAG
jgi:hypothetical protein